MRLKRVAVSVAMTAMATLGVTAAAAPASAATTTSGAVSIAGENYVQCGYSYDDCYAARSNFARYYRVSPIYQWPDGCTLPGGCPELTYFFYYYD